MIFFTYNLTSLPFPFKITALDSLKLRFGSVRLKLLGSLNLKLWKMHNSPYIHPAVQKAWHIASKKVLTVIKRKKVASKFGWTENISDIPRNTDDYISGRILIIYLFTVLHNRYTYRINFCWTKNFSAIPRNTDNYISGRILIIYLFTVLHNRYTYRINFCWTKNFSSIPRNTDDYISGIILIIYMFTVFHKRYTL